jgi:hypothetical protein
MKSFFSLVILFMTLSAQAEPVDQNLLDGKHISIHCRQQFQNKKGYWYRFFPQPGNAESLVTMKLVHEYRKDGLVWFAQFMDEGTFFEGYGESPMIPGSQRKYRSYFQTINEATELVILLPTAKMELKMFMYAGQIVIKEARILGFNDSWVGYCSPPDLQMQNTNSSPLHRLGKPR